MNSSLLLIVCLCLEYIVGKNIFSNIGEYKIYSGIIQNSEKQNQAGGYFYILDHTPFTYDEVVDVKLKFQGDSMIQNGAILTLQNGTYVVTQIEYNKFIESQNITMTSYNVIPDGKFVNSSVKCFGIAYYEGQIVTDCSIETTPQLYENYLILQNGTLIQQVGTGTLENRSIQQQDETIYRNYGNMIQELGKNLSITDSYENIIQIISTDDSQYLLTQHTLGITDKVNTHTIKHNCEQIPTSMAVFSESIYIACGNLVKVNPEGEVTNSSVAATNLQSTEQYLIIDGLIVYSIQQDRSITQIVQKMYPTGTWNQIIAIGVDKLYVGLIEEVTILGKSDPSHFTINENEYWVVNQGITILNNTMGNYPYIKETQQYDDFVTGPDVSVFEGGVDITMLKQSFDLPNITLLRIVNLQNSDIVIFFLEGANFNLLICKDQQIFDCPFEDHKVLETQVNQDTITDCQAVFYNDTLQYGYKINSEFKLFIGGQAVNVPQSLNRIIRGEYIVFVNDNNITIQSDDGNSQYFEFESIKCVSIDQNLINVCIKDRCFVLAQQQSEQYVIIDSFFIQNQPKYCSSYDGQLFIFSNDHVEVVKEGYQRGSINMDFGNSNYIVTLFNVYLYNETHIIQFNMQMDQSLSAAISKILIRQNNGTKSTVVATYTQIKNGDMDLVFADDILLLFNTYDLFIIDTYTTLDQYHQAIEQHLSFSNSYGQFGNTSVVVVGQQVETIAKNTSEIPVFPVYNNQASIHINQLFEGPILTVGIEGKSHSIQQQAYLVGLIDYNVIDTIVITNHTLILTTNNTVLSCNHQINNCTIVQEYQDNCTELSIQNQTIHVICNTAVHQLNQTNLTQTLQTQMLNSTDQLISIESNNQMIVTRTRSINDTSTNLNIYYNDTVITKQLANDVVDFTINDTSIILVTHDKLSICDTNLTCIDPPFLLLDIIQLTTQVKLFNNTKIISILRVTDEVYIIQTFHAPVFKIYLQPPSCTIIGYYVIPQFYLISDIQQIDNRYVMISLVDINQQNQIILFNEQQSSNTSLAVASFQMLLPKQKLANNKYAILTSNGFVMANPTSNRTLQLYTISQTVQITVINPTSEIVELSAFGQYDIARTLIRLNQGGNTTTDTTNKQHWSLTSTLIIIGCIAGAFILYYLSVQIRRCYMLRQLKFQETQPSEFQSEYI